MDSLQKFNTVYMHMYIYIRIQEFHVQQMLTIYSMYNVLVQCNYRVSHTYGIPPAAYCIPRTSTVQYTVVSHKESPLQAYCRRTAGILQYSSG